MFQGDEVEEGGRQGKNGEGAGSRRRRNEGAAKEVVTWMLVCLHCTPHPRVLAPGKSSTGACCSLICSTYNNVLLFPL